MTEHPKKPPPADFRIARGGPRGESQSSTAQTLQLTGIDTNDLAGFRFTLFPYNMGIQLSVGSLIGPPREGMFELRAMALGGSAGLVGSRGERLPIMVKREGPSTFSIIVSEEAIASQTTLTSQPDY